MQCVPPINNVKRGFESVCLAKIHAYGVSDLHLCF